MTRLDEDEDDDDDIDGNGEEAKEHDGYQVLVKPASILELDEIIVGALNVDSFEYAQQGISLHQEGLLCLILRFMHVQITKVLLLCSPPVRTVDRLLFEVEVDIRSRLQMIPKFPSES